MASGVMAGGRYDKAGQVIGAAAFAAAAGAIVWIVVGSQAGTGPAVAYIVCLAVVGALAGAMSHRAMSAEARAAAADEEAASLRDAAGQLLAQALEAEERERERIAQSLHDGTLQTLLVAHQDLIEASERPEVVGEARRVVGDAISEMRAAVTDLHPTTARYGDVESGLTAIANRAGATAGFESTVRVERGLSSDHSALVLSIARELLANVVKHASATRVQVSVRRAQADLTLTVADDGVGMSRMAEIPALRVGHVGISSIEERLRAVGGKLEISRPPGGGTVVTVTLPAGGS